MKKHRHSVENLGGGRFRVVLDKRAGGIIPGSSSDPWAICELMALEALRGDLEREESLHEMQAEEPEPVAPPSDATREERRIAELQNLASSAEHFRDLLLNEGLDASTPFAGNPERARARRRLRERGASFVNSTASAYERVASGIKSLGSVIAGLIER